VANLVDSAPDTLNTLAELATSIGNSTTLSSTLTSSIATKLPLAGGTLTGNLNLGDNVRARFGLDSDLQIYHDGNHSYINESGTGFLKVLTSNFALQNAAGNESMINADQNGAVTLYYDNAAKLATTATGIDVTGTVNASGTVFFNTELRANNVSNKLIIKADSSATELHASGSTGIIFKNSGNGNIASFDASAHFKITNDFQMGSTNPRIDYDNNQSTGSLRLFSTSRNAASHQFYPNGHAHFITTAGTFKIEGLGSTSNQIESGGSLKIRSVSGHVDLLDGTTEVLQTTTTGVTLPLNLVVNGKLGINENSLSSNARLQVRYDNSQSYSAYNALTNPSMIIKNITAGASKFTSLGFITEANGEGAISLVQGSGNINADMTFSVRSSGTRAEHMRITHDGNVGIGTSAPLNSLHVKKGSSGSSVAADASDAIILEHSDSVLIDIRTPAANTGGILFSDPGARARGAIQYSHGTDSMYFNTAGATALTLFPTVISSEVNIAIKNGKTLEFQTTGGAARGFISAQETNTGGTHPAGLILATSNGEAISFKDNNIGGTTNMIITGAGSVGIGTPNPGERLHVEGSVLIDAFNIGDEEGIFFREGFSSTNKYNVSIMAKDHNGSAADGISINGYDGISFCTGSNNRNEVMRIIGGSSGVGNVGIGTQSPAFTAVSGSTNQIGLEIQNANNDSSAHLKLTGRNNTGTPGQATSFEIAHRGDALKTSFIHGGTEVWNFDSSGHAHLGMNDSDTRLTLGSLGTPNTNSSNNIRSVGTILRNNAGGSTGTHEWEINGALKLQIQSSGVLQTTTTGSGDGYDIIARSTDGGDTGLELTRNGTAGFGIAVRAAATDYADFQVNDGGSPSYGETGKMRLYSSGNISVPGTALWSSGVGNILSPTGSHYMVRTSTSTGNETMIISNTVGTGGLIGVLQYRNGGTVRGDYLIASQSAGIYFNSASDYRFKENVTTITDSYLTKLTSLRPVTYTHSADMDEDTLTVHTGFIAHEVEEIFPEFVEGDKDAIYTQEDLDAKGDPETTTESVGDPLYQSVAYSKKEWNVYIVKALQELKAQNEALKARIEVLEG
jgi:hypothetical protein